MGVGVGVVRSFLLKGFKASSGEQLLGARLGCLLSHALACGLVWVHSEDLTVMRVFACVPMPACRLLGQRCGR